MRTPFAALFDRRDSLENPNTSFDRWSGWDAFAGAVTSAGVSLSDEKAASVPDVFACIQVLSQDLGRCPLKLRKINPDGSHEDATDHPLYEILADLTNPEMTAYEFRTLMQRNLLVYGRAYAEIIRNGRGEVTGLWPLQPQCMKVTRNSLNVKVWTYQVPGQSGPITWTFHPSVPPIFELTHPSPMQQCRDLIGLAYALDMFGAKFFANGARPSGTLAAPVGVTVGNEAKTAMRESFQKMFSGAENAGKVAFMEGGVTFTPMTIPNNEAQYNETRKFIRSLVSGVFRVAPHKIGDLERATFSNIEQLSIDHVQSMDPFFSVWEQTARRDVLTTRQFSGYVAQFDRQALIKADVKSMLDALAVARQNGVYNANDIRKKLGENPIEGDAGSLYMVNSAMVPTEKAGAEPPAPPEPVDPNAGRIAALETEVAAVRAARQPIEVHSAAVTVAPPSVQVDVHLPGPVPTKRTFKRDKKTGLVEEEVQRPIE